MNCKTQVLPRLLPCWPDKSPPSAAPHTLQLLAEGGSSPEKGSARDAVLPPEAPTGDPVLWSCCPHPARDPHGCCAAKYRRLLPTHVFAWSFPRPGWGGCSPNPAQTPVPQLWGEGAKASRGDGSPARRGVCPGVTQSGKFSLQTQPALPRGTGGSSASHPRANPALREGHANQPLLAKRWANPFHCRSHCSEHVSPTPCAQPFPAGPGTALAATASCRRPWQR